MDIQDGRNGDHLRFPIGKVSAISSFKSIRLSVQEKRKIDFQDCGIGSHLKFLIGMIFAILIYKSPDASYQVSSQLAF